jgi:two-component system chemotaxis response regulator CheB
VNEFKPDIFERFSGARMLLVGGSAGSFNPLRTLIEGLPEDFPIPVVVLVHRGKKFPDLLGKLLRNKANVKIREASDKEMPVPGVVYLAPADYHLLIEWDGSFSFDVSDPVWFCRPSIDVLFESAADSMPGKCIAILLSGANADGARGLERIHQGGGITLAQSPKEAEFPVMPDAAVQRNAVNAVFFAAEIPDILAAINKTYHR